MFLGIIKRRGQDVKTLPDGIRERLQLIPRFRFRASMRAVPIRAWSVRACRWSPGESQIGCVGQFLARSLRDDECQVVQIEKLLDSREAVRARVGDNPCTIEVRTQNRIVRV